MGFVLVLFFFNEWADSGVCDWEEQDKEAAPVPGADPQTQHCIPKPNPKVVGTTLQQRVLLLS